MSQEVGKNTLTEESVVVALIELANEAAAAYAVSNYKQHEFGKRWHTIAAQLQERHNVSIYRNN